MKVKSLLIASLVLAALLAAFGFWAAGQLPPGTELPTHWNAAGEADDWMPALHALMVAPGMMLFVGLLFAAIPRLEPLQDKLEASAPVLRAAWIGMMALAVFLQAFIAAPVFGVKAEGHWVMAALGILFILLGNAMPKSRPGFFVGIRTPWTITNTDNWIATHRLGGKTFMAGGAIMVAIGLLDLAPEVRMVGTLSAIVLAGLVPVVYSWWFWHSGKAAT